MGERLFDMDMPTRTVQTFSMDDMDRITIRTNQNVEPVLDYVKRMGNMNVTRDSKAKKGMFRHVGAVATSVWDKVQNDMAEMNLSKDERRAYVKKFLNGDGSCWKFDKSFQI